jgi:biotin carboxylase/SAM-dependent methyltransferase
LYPVHLQTESTAILGRKERMPLRLLILGANRYNLAGIQAARAAGFFTLVADRNAAAPGLAAADVPLAVDLVNVEALLDAVRAAGGIDGVITMAEAGVCPAAALAARLGLPSIGSDAAANATSKAAMRRLWAGLGHCSPPYRIVTTEAEALAAADALGRYPLILKPDRSFGGSRGVSRVESRAEVAPAFAFAQAADLERKQVVIEHCMEGTEHSCEVLIWRGETSVLCIGQKVKSAPPYRVDLSVQYPAELSGGQQAEVARMGHQAVSALGLTRGVAHVEFAMTADGPVLFELGARCGGGHTPQIAREVSGVDEFIEACRMACGQEPNAFRPLRSGGADYRFLIFPPGQFQEALIPEAVAAHPAVIDVGITLSSGATIEPVRTTADRAGFLVTRAADRREAVSLADELSGAIRVRYADGAERTPLAVGELAGAKAPLAEHDAAAVVARYQERIRRHGVTFESMASGSLEKQRIRHYTHALALRGDNPAVLDIGCGLGQFYEYLKERGLACRFTGYDLVPEYVAHCRSRFPEAEFETRNIFQTGIGGHFDTIVMSQVLNNHYRDSNNRDVMQTALRLAYAHTRVSVSVDMMSSYVDFQSAELYYYSPEEVFRFAKSFCRRVILRHDFRPFEFCIQLFHDDVEGFVP